METSDCRSHVFATLEESVCREPTVTFVVAFGSRVSGEPRLSSDFDLAVKFADDLSARERFHTQCFLSGILQQEGAPFVDLSDIETLPLEVAHDAVSGEFVCGDERAFRQFKSAIEATFVDQREDIRREQRRVIDRIAEEGLRG